MAFDSRGVVSETLRGIATLTLERPETLNALDAELVARLADAFHAAASDPDVAGIAIAGAGRAFVAGADVRFFLRHVQAGNLEPIVEFTKAAHALFNAIDDCPKPVVARVHGAALGAGVELALACDRIVASPAATFSFPETGVGIYPGQFARNWDPNRGGRSLSRRLDTADVVAIKDGLATMLGDIFREELAAGGYQVVNEPGPDTLLVIPAIVDLYITAPDTMSAGRGRTYTANSGRMTLVLELRDSVTGETLARVVDAQSGRNTGVMTISNRMTNTADASRAMRIWAQALCSGLDSLYKGGA